MTHQIQHVTLRAILCVCVCLSDHDHQEAQTHFKLSLSTVAVWGKILATTTFRKTSSSFFCRNLSFWSKLQVRFTFYLDKSSHFTNTHDLGFPWVASYVFLFGITAPSYTPRPTSRKVQEFAMWKTLGKTRVFCDDCATGGPLWYPNYTVNYVNRIRTSVNWSLLKFTKITDKNSWAVITWSKYQCFNIRLKLTFTAHCNDKHNFSNKNIHAWKLLFHNHIASHSC